MSFLSRLFHTASISNTPPTEKSTVFVIGLGNPGKKYVNTRHNLGFLALDKLKQSLHGSDWQLEKKISGRDKRSDPPTVQNFSCQTTDLHE